MPRYVLLPEQIKIHCSDKKCGHETWWEVEEQKVYFSGMRINQRLYKCKNCDRRNVVYCFIWLEQEEQNLFVKVGQYPELEERVPESLEKTLGPADLKMYKNALRMRNFNLGIAAVAYMRRVVENRMNDMLEILYEAAVAHNVLAELLARHMAVKAEKRFAVKVEYAGDLLPAYLRPPGKPNPIQILHELASDGIHARSDEECVDIFDSCRKTFEFVFGSCASRPRTQSNS